MRPRKAPPSLKAGPSISGGFSPKDGDLAVLGIVLGLWTYAVLTLLF